MRTRHRPLRRAVHTVAAALSLVLVAVAFVFVLPKIANYGEVWKVTRALPADAIAGLVAVAALNVISTALPWLAALPRLGPWHAFRVALGPSALSLVAPGGGAVSMAVQFGMLRSWGLDKRTAGVAAAVTNLWGQLASYGFPVLAIAALSLEGDQPRALLAVAVVGFATVCGMMAGVALTLWSSELASRVGANAARAVNAVRRVVRMRPVAWGGPEFARFRAEALELLRRQWHVLTLATLASQLGVFVVLVVTLRAVGISAASVTIVEAFAAWALIRTLGKLPITPGGLGVEEVALVGALIGFGAEHAPAVSATLIYRFLTIVPTLVAGLGVAATYRLGRPDLAKSDSVP